MNRDVFKEKVSKFIDAEKYWFEVKEYDGGRDEYYLVTIGDNEDHKIKDVILYSDDEDLEKVLGDLICCLSPECKRCNEGVGRYMYMDSTREQVNQCFICKECFKKTLGI